jgi:hypothetical protein
MPPRGREGLHTFLVGVAAGAAFLAPRTGERNAVRPAKRQQICAWRSAQAGVDTGFRSGNATNARMLERFLSPVNVKPL